MKIEISIEKDGKESDSQESGAKAPSKGYTHEQLAMLAKRLKSGMPLKRAERMMLADYLMQETED